jgi:predicted nucleic acid-binding protein
MDHIYLDSNILIAYYSSDPSEKQKKELVLKALCTFSQLQDVQICTSMWAVAETINILLSRHQMNRADIGDIESQFTNERRLENLKVHFLDVSPKKSYDFIEFFYHIRQDILKYHSGVGDIIHNVIMRNNGVDKILTFDEKDDFRQIPGLTVLNPKEIKL